MGNKMNNWQNTVQLKNFAGWIQDQICRFFENTQNTNHISRNFYKKNAIMHSYKSVGHSYLGDIKSL